MGRGQRQRQRERERAESEREWGGRESTLRKLKMSLLLTFDDRFDALKVPIPVKFCMWKDTSYSCISI